MFIYLCIIIHYNMEKIIKQTREVGTSAGVLLPRSWLNKQVVVTLLSPSKEEIIRGIMEIILRYNLNEEVKGIYLFGSYAREDYDAESDIDVLVITQKTTRLINYNNYEILFVSEKDFSKNIYNNLNYLSAINEVKVILNRELIKKYALKKKKFNLKKYFVEIERILKINKETVEFCEDNKINVPDGVVYSIVLRLRELYLIKCIFSEKSYYKKDFIKIIGDKINISYLRIKKNEKDLSSISPSEVKEILSLSEKWLKELKERKKE